MLLTHALGDERHSALFEECSGLKHKLYTAIFGDGLKQDGLVDKSHLDEYFTQEQALPTSNLGCKCLPKLVGSERAVLNKDLSKGRERRKLNIV
jgi:hypothetical protein